MVEKTDKKTRWLKPSRGADWTIDNDDRSATEVKEFIKGISVKEIQDAGASYVDACSVVANAQWVLGQEAEALAKVWEGKASVTAQKALRTIYVALGELSDKLLAMGRPLETLAEVVRQHQEFIDGKLSEEKRENSSFGLGGDGHDHIVFNGVLQSGKHGVKLDFHNLLGKLAGLQLEAFSKDLEAIYSTLPKTVEMELPAIAYPVAPHEKPETVDYRFGERPSAGASDRSPSHISPTDTDRSGGGPALPAGADSSAPHGERAHFPGDPEDRDRADLSQGPDSSSSDAAPGGTNAPRWPAILDANGNEASPGDPTRGSNDPTSALDRPTNLHTKLADFQRPIDSDSSPIHFTPKSPNHPAATDPGNLGASMGSGSGAPATINGIRATATNGTGSPFMPMSGMGGASGQEEKERESATWLHEDDDVWGGDMDGVVHNRIG
ncbi:hypothetical protein AB0H88_10785 [Nonomuraea sp. NPDC050680]|uniref:hypothetical protein n=1 Tax=Nonomuraea sp. NPDC050680 TaxID=3154630 RepID=UPI0033CC07F4